MKALVLAGGHGTRLRPLTHTQAKQLIPVGNKPVLWYGLEALNEAGLRDVGMIVGDTAAEVQSSVGDGSRFGLRITYLRQEAPLGLAHAVMTAREFLGEDDFVMYLGDNFLLGGITALVDRFAAERPDAGVLVTKVADPTKFGVAHLDEAGRITRLEEKPAHPASDLAVVGVYFFTPAVHAAVRAISPSARGELEITDALQWLIDDGATVAAEVVTGYWKDTGRVDDILECNRMVLEDLPGEIVGAVDDETVVSGRVAVAAGATVRRSRLIGPMIIGPGATVTDSYVGPFTSIGPRCALDGCEIEFSIVMAESRLVGVGRVHDSLLGRGVDVAPAAQPPAAPPHRHRLVLGDHSLVRIA